jgi:hypothetical protein
VHDLRDELGLRCQVDITAGAARAWTNVDERFPLGRSKSVAAVAARSGYAQAQPPAGPAEAKQDTPDKFLLMDYRPESIYSVPKTEVMKAKYPVIDVHCHGPEGSQQVGDMVKVMDAVGVEKTVIFTGESTPERFGQVREHYVKYPTRFDLWCSFDLTGVNEPAFGPNALKALEDLSPLGRGGWGRGRRQRRWNVG